MEGGNKRWKGKEVVVCMSHVHSRVRVGAQAMEGEGGCCLYEPGSQPGPSPVGAQAMEGEGGCCLYEPGPQPGHMLERVELEMDSWDTLETAGTPVTEN